jgi:histone deacetylase 11
VLFKSFLHAMSDDGSVQAIEPKAATDEILLDVHDISYIQSLHSSPAKLASVIEFPPIALLPMFILRRRVLEPMRTHVGGTILAVGLAAQRGWAINLGGGMHHATFKDGVFSSGSRHGQPLVSRVQLQYLHTCHH